MSNAVSISAANALLDEAEDALARDLPQLRRELDELLALYDGIPSAIDVFDVLGLHGDEDRHTAFLAWLLEPAGTHGLGSVVLQRFLQLVDDPELDALRASRGPLSAWVCPWLDLRDAGVPDLVVVIEERKGHGIALVVEAKIGAALTYSGSGEAQTIRYVRAVATAEGIENLILAPCRASSRLQVSDCRPVFVFLRADPTQEADPDRVLDRHKYRNVEYSEVERMLGSLVKEADIAPVARALIQQFRTSLLAEAVPEATSLDALGKLRQARLRRSGAPDYRKAQELRSLVIGFTGVSGNG